MTIKPFVDKPSTLLITAKRTLKNWVEKLRQFHTLSPEEMVEKLTDLMFKFILFLGIPYFVYIFFSFLLK